MSTLQDYHLGRGGQYDSRCASRFTADHGKPRAHYALLFSLQLRDEVRLSLPTTLSDTKPLSRIIEPLASRCSKFRFKPLDSSSAQQRLEHIARAEQVPASQDVISALIATSAGDLRRAITYLQSAARLSASTDPPSAILPRDIQEIAGVVPDAVIRKLAQTLGIDVTLIGGGDGDVEMDDAPSLTVESNLRGFDLIRETVRSLVREGFSASQVLSQVCARSLL